MPKQKTAEEQAKKPKKANLPRPVKRKTKQPQIDEPTHHKRRKGRLPSGTKNVSRETSPKVRKPRTWTDEQRKAQSERMKGRKGSSRTWTDEQRKAQSERMKQRWQEKKQSQVPLLEQPQVPEEPQPQAQEKNIASLDDYIFTVYENFENQISFLPQQEYTMIEEAWNTAIETFGDITVARAISDNQPAINTLVEALQFYKAGSPQHTSALNELMTVFTGNYLALEQQQAIAELTDNYDFNEDIES